MTDHREVVHARVTGISAGLAIHAEVQEPKWAGPSTDSRGWVYRPSQFTIEIRNLIGPYIGNVMISGERASGLRSHTSAPIDDTGVVRDKGRGGLADWLADVIDAVLREQSPRITTIRAIGRPL